MLPILRILPVGGVLLAILILLLALTPPGGARRALPHVTQEARGPLIDRNDHPEWRQFLILTALQRADAIERLRDLPDRPVVRAPQPPAQAEIVIPLPAPAAATEASLPHTDEIAAPVPPKAAPTLIAEDAPMIIAALPSERSDSDLDNDDVTGTITESPGATIPIDIGETSSTELPVAQPEERPPVIRAPERAKPPRDSKNKSGQHARHTKTAHKRTTKLASKLKRKVAPKPKPVAQLTLFETIFGPLRPDQQPGAVNTLGASETGPSPAQANAAAN
jgi:hypothetical protein